MSSLPKLNTKGNLAGRSYVENRIEYWLDREYMTQGEIRPVIPKQKMLMASKICDVRTNCDLSSDPVNWIQKQTHRVLDGLSKYCGSDQAGERKTEKSKAKPGKKFISALTNR
jgi:hypothetical protein